jgi:hypothetical protein
VREHGVDVLRRDGLVGAAVEEDAVLSVGLDLDDGVALRGLGAAEIPQIDAAALQQLRQRLPAPSMPAWQSVWPLRATAMDWFRPLPPAFCV